MSLYSESKCIGVTAKSVCKTCKDMPLCSGCTIACHKHHDVQEIENAGSQCDCIHDNPFMPRFVAMFKPVAPSEGILDSKSSYITPGDVIMNIPDDNK